MKKLITLIAGLLLVALPVGLAGCDDSDNQGNHNHDNQGNNN